MSNLGGGESHTPPDVTPEAAGSAVDQVHYSFLRQMTARVGLAFDSAVGFTREHPILTRLGISLLAGGAVDVAGHVGAIPVPHGPQVLTVHEHPGYTIQMSNGNTDTVYVPDAPPHMESLNPVGDAMLRVGEDAIAATTVYSSLAAISEVSDAVRERAARATHSNPPTV